MPPQLAYAEPADLRRALKDMLTRSARRTGFTSGQLLVHVGFDRLLARLFTAPDAEEWMLKGAGGLLARLANARHTRDIDLSASGDLRAAEASLRLAAGRDIGDHFFVRTAVGTPLRGPVPGLRIPVQVELGKPYAAFHVDVVAGMAPSGQVEEVPPLTSVRIPGLVQPPYRAYPLADHVADKLAGVLATYPKRRGAAVPSSRYKDLADLALIAGGSRLVASRLHVALNTMTAQRALDLPPRFEVPDEPRWRAGYNQLLGEATPLPSYSDAVQLVAAFLDPLLGGRNRGWWDPAEHRWHDAVHDEPCRDDNGA